ncbi:hypothetical protein WG66_000068 [Moniliophthora roreri]|uniref:Uncharacterized protein n=1 Tax=Moniliophthora roreri TaxID=221103 RepID=A0A0W0FUA5_MONRR|nr:hypothetical protein WG66_000068 [Moniliophthora roreri]
MHPAATCSTQACSHSDHDLPWNPRPNVERKLHRNAHDYPANVEKCSRGHPDTTFSHNTAFSSGNPHTAVQDANQNKDPLRRPFNDSFGMTITVVKACERMMRGGRMPPALQSALEALTSAMGNILEFAKSQTQNHFDTTTINLVSDALASREDRCRQQLQRALNHFSLIDVHHALELLLLNQTELRNAGNDPHPLLSPSSNTQQIPVSLSSLLAPEATRFGISIDAGLHTPLSVLASPQFPSTGPWNIHNHNNYTTNVYYVSGDQYQNVNNVNRSGNP